MSHEPQRPVILTFVRFYLPGHRSGGPVRSISNLVERLGHEFEFRIVTSDRDSGDHEPYPDAGNDRWTSVGNAQVMYLAPERQSWRTMRKLVATTPHDAVYLNGVFHPQYTVFPLLATRRLKNMTTPVIVVPRGELGPGALALKVAKKRVFLWFAKLTGIYGRVVWQATCAEERQQIESVFGADVNVWTARNLGALPADVEQSAAPKKPGELRLVFLSRLARKKNVHGALEMLRQIRGNVTFTIHGPKRDMDYWNQCERIAASLPGNVSVVYGGPVDHDKVSETLSRHHVFYFPTQGENYGHAIVEAFCAGLPVLTSDQTPWRELETNRVGWDVPLSEPARFREIIEQCVNMHETEFAELSRNAYAYGRQIATDPEAVEQHRRMFRGTIAQNNVNADS